MMPSLMPRRRAAIDYAAAALLPLRDLLMLCACHIENAPALIFELL